MGFHDSASLCQLTCESPNPLLPLHLFPTLIYRNPNVSPEEIAYKDSTIRLRDAVPTPDDYALWEKLADPARLEEEWAQGAVWIVGDEEGGGLLFHHANSTFFSSQNVADWCGN